MAVGVLLLAGLQDVLSGGAKESIDALFQQPGTADAFNAGCALATSLDEAGWNLFGTAVLPLVLRSTSTYLAATGSQEELEFGQVSMARNALTLVARLAWSGRLGEAYQVGGATIKTWERIVGATCEIGRAHV